MARAERLLAERAVPGAARRGRAARRRRSPRRGCRRREARLAQRDETLRTGGGAAAGQCVRAARADRRPGRRGHGDARRVVRRRRAALSDRRGPTASSCRRRCRRPTRRSARDVASLALEIPGRADPIAAAAASHARRRRHRPGDPRAAGAVRGRQPRRPAADRPDGHRHPLHGATAARCRPCRRRRC